MTKYRIILDRFHGFGVAITSPERFLSVRGFATRVLAEVWIAEQELVQAAIDATAKIMPENDAAAQPLARCGYRGGNTGANQ